MKQSLLPLLQKSAQISASLLQNIYQTSKNYLQTIKQLAQNNLLSHSSEKLTDLNSYSSRLIQRLSQTYQNRSRTRTTWTITPQITSTADTHSALTFQEFTDNLIEYQRLNEFRWNDEAIKNAYYNN